MVRRLAFALLLLFNGSLIGGFCNAEEGCSSSEGFPRCVYDGVWFDPDYHELNFDVKQPINLATMDEAATGYTIFSGSPKKPTYFLHYLDENLQALSDTELKAVATNPDGTTVNIHLVDSIKSDDDRCVKLNGTNAFSWYKGVQFTFGELAGLTMENGKPIAWSKIMDCRMIGKDSISLRDAEIVQEMCGKGGVLEKFIIGAWQLITCLISNYKEGDIAGKICTGGV